MNENRIDRKAIAGMNTYSCPACKRLNKALAKRNRRPKYFGTAFIPINLKTATTLRVYGGTLLKSVVGRGQGCGHVINVSVSM